MGTSTNGHLLAAALAIAVSSGAAAPIAAAEPSWSAVTTPSPAPAAVFGSYNLGCVAGAVALPLTGPGFQVMRPSRNRYYGHPDLIAYITRLAEAAPSAGWQGLLIGDLAQPRGGPMSSGHRSHQVGLDVDIWLTPAPDRVLSMDERESIGALSVVSEDGESVNERWTDAHAAFVRLVVEDADVDRAFVNPAIKRALCAASGGEGEWLRKVRPWWGHDAHIHVRLRCPVGDPGCQPQDAIAAGSGCDADLQWWFSAEAREERRKAAERPPAAPRVITLDEMPANCRAVIGAP